MPSIGIDLGTTNSCVAVLEHDQVEIITNDLGERITPPCVAFTNEERLIGSPAKKDRKDNPRNTIVGVKRLMGKKFDKNVKQDKQNWQHQVFEFEGRPKIRVQTSEGMTTFTPEQISGIILEKMKDVAEDRLGKVYNAVVTVPAYFNDSQRNATLDAAKLAKLNVLRIINEPTAAAIAYGVQRKTNKIVLVYDLGGGTFDVTLLKINGSDFDVIATGGDTHLGGDDFNNVMAEYLAKEIEGKVGNNIRKDSTAMVILHEHCEEAKIMLSSRVKQIVAIKGLRKNLDFKTEIYRATFERLNGDLFEKTFKILEKVLEDAKMTKKQVDDVLLVGGSTRIPYIQRRMTEMFGEDKVRKSINPDEAVAYGAAAYSSHLSGLAIPNIGEIRLRDVTALSLGIAVKGELTDVIIRRNTRIPVEREKSYFTTEDGQTSARIKIYQGDRAKIQDNYCLGEFLHDKIPPMPAGVAQVDVKFCYSRNGTLDVTARETTTGSSAFTVTNADVRKLTSKQIQDQIAVAEKWKAKDDEHRANVKARNNLEATINRLKKSGNLKKVIRKSKEIEKWLREHKTAAEYHFVAKQRQLEALSSSKGDESSESYSAAGNSAGTGAEALNRRDSSDELELSSESSDEN